MNKLIGTFQSARWGEVVAARTTYQRPSGPLAVLLYSDSGPLATLSVNLALEDGPSHDSRDLPPDCFYVKTWSENEKIAEEARQSGLFIERPDLGTARSGFVTCPVWQVRGE